MSRAAAALEDPAVAQALRSYRAASARLSGLADSATRLEESFASEDELRAVELAADEAQVELGDAARTLDELLGDDVLARKLRMAKEETLKIPDAISTNGTTLEHAPPAEKLCKVEGCGAKSVAHRVCNGHLWRIRSAIERGLGSMENLTFVEDAIAGKFLQRSAGTRSKEGAPLPKAPRVSRKPRAERLDEGTHVTPRAVTPAVAVAKPQVAKASPPPTYNEASSLCDELKAKLAARSALDVEIRDLAARLARATGAA